MESHVWIFADHNKRVRTNYTENSKLFREGADPVNTITGWSQVNEWQNSNRQIKVRTSIHS